MTITKAYMDALVTGMNFKLNKPSTPMDGDYWFDINTNDMFVYTGGSWVRMAGNPPEPPKRVLPTFEELEKYPGLRAAWEEYLVMRKLLGI